MRLYLLILFVATFLLFISKFKSFSLCFSKYFHHFNFHYWKNIFLLLFLLFLKPSASLLDFYEKMKFGLQECQKINLKANIYFQKWYQKIFQVQSTQQSWILYIYRLKSEWTIWLFLSWSSILKELTNVQQFWSLQ